MLRLLFREGRPWGLMFWAGRGGGGHFQPSPWGWVLGGVVLNPLLDALGGFQFQAWKHFFPGVGGQKNCFGQKNLFLFFFRLLTRK